MTTSLSFFWRRADFPGIVVVVGEDMRDNARGGRWEFKRRSLGQGLFRTGPRRRNRCSVTCEAASSRLSRVALLTSIQLSAPALLLQLGLQT